MTHDEQQIEQQAKRDWDKDADLRAEFRGRFEAYLAFCKADARGSVQIPGRPEKQAADSQTPTNAHGKFRVVRYG